MKTPLLYILIFLLFFISCSKEDNRQAVNAGIYNTDFIYKEFSSPLKVKLILDTLTNDYIGRDSIDLNRDGVYDIIINHRIHLPPVSGVPSNEHFPYFKLIIKNGLQVATKVQFYSVGHGQLDDVHWVDALNYENRIDVWPDWTEKNNSQFMWAIPPVASAPYGPWYDLTNEEKYIGFRMKIESRFKYGWIKVKVISREDMQFLSYALEK